MSKGTPVTTVRLPRGLHAEIEAYLARRTELTLVDPWTMTDFLTCACRELLRKKAWRKGKAVVIQQSVETDNEQLLETAFLSEETVCLLEGSVPQ